MVLGGRATTVLMVEVAAQVVREGRRGLVAQRAIRLHRHHHDGVEIAAQFALKVPEVRAPRVRHRHRCADR